MATSRDVDLADGMTDLTLEIIAKALFDVDVAAEATRLARYDVSLSDDQGDVTPEALIAVRPRGGLRVTLTRKAAAPCATVRTLAPPASPG